MLIAERKTDDVNWSSVSEPHSDTRVNFVCASVCPLPLTQAFLAQILSRSLGEKLPDFSLRLQDKIKASPSVCQSVHPYVRMYGPYTTSILKKKFSLHTTDPIQHNFSRFTRMLLNWVTCSLVIQLDSQIDFLVNTYPPIDKASRNGGMYIDNTYGIIHGRVAGAPPLLVPALTVEEAFGHL